MSTNEDVIDCPPGHLLLVVKEPSALVAATQETIDFYISEFQKTERSEMERALERARQLIPVEKIDPQQWGLAALVCAIAPSVLYGEPILHTDPEDVRKRTTRVGSKITVSSKKWIR